MHSAETLYVVADGGHARLIRFKDKHFHTIKQFDSEHLHDRSHDLGRSPPSRVQESGSPARHAAETHSDPHSKVKHNFVMHIASVLKNDRSIGSFDALVLAAPGRVLGELRDALPADLGRKVPVTVAKDLTKIPDVDLTHHLPEPSPMWLKA